MALNDGGNCLLGFGVVDVLEISRWQVIHAGCRSDADIVGNSQGQRRFSRE
jgi:hypothetical protein